MAARDQTTVGAYRQQTVERVFSGLLSARFAEMAQKPDAPFLDAETSRGLFVRTTEATSLNALVAEGGVEKGLAALFTESRARRAVRLHGRPSWIAIGSPPCRPTSSSPCRTRSTLSNSLADEYIRNFMQHEPIPGIAYENGLVKRFLPEITLAEVNALARDWMPDRNRVVVGQRAEEGRRGACPTRRRWRRSSRAPAATS